jgi:hypothetical protein
MLRTSRQQTNSKQQTSNIEEGTTPTSRKKNIPYLMIVFFIFLLVVVSWEQHTSADNLFDPLSLVGQNEQQQEHSLPQTGEQKLIIGDGDLTDPLAKLRSTTGAKEAVNVKQSNLSQHSNDNDNRKTAVIITTHLIPSHPSLDNLLQVIDSIKINLAGLPDKAPLYITVDGLAGQTDKLFLNDSEGNIKKIDLYLKALYKHFAGQDHIHIIAAERNIGLSGNLRRVVDSLDPETKYMYLIQHDLPFVKLVNHTIILDTAERRSDLRIVRFAWRKSPPPPCSGPGTEDIISITGNPQGEVVFRKGKKWSDQNHFARVDHYRNDILPILGGIFPEMTMNNLAKKNCSYFAPYYYNRGEGGAVYEHTDATGRYSFKLADRVRNGELKFSALSVGNKKEMRRGGVNITELELASKAHSSM